MQPNYGKSGMTLVEVLLAAALLGVGLSVLLTAASRSLAVMKIARNYQKAQWTFNMGELDYPLVAITNEVKELAVSSERYENGFVYEREVEDEAGGEEDDLHVVRARVTWSSRNREATEEVVRYVYFKDEED